MRPFSLAEYREGLKQPMGCVGSGGESFQKFAYVPPPDGLSPLVVVGYDTT